MQRLAGVLILLVLLSSAVQAWTIRQAVVPAQDSVRYVGVAQRIESQGWLNTIRKEPEHPLFPTLVWLAHQWFASDSEYASWERSVQLAAALPLILAVIPVHLSLRRFVNPRPAILGSALFCLLPEVSGLGADGLSDSTHLLLAATAMWGISACLSRLTGGIHWSALAGLSTGFALLARSEALVLAPAFFLALVAGQRFSETRIFSRRLVGVAAAFCFSTAAVLCPYLMLARSGPEVRAAQKSLHPEIAATAPKFAWLDSDGAKLLFPVKEPSVTSRFKGHWAALREYAKELSALLRIWGIGLAIVGLCLGDRSNRSVAIFMTILCVSLSLASIHYASSAGYLSSRHLLLLAVPAVGAIGQGTVAIAQRIPSHKIWTVVFAGPMDQSHLSACSLVAVASLVCAACLPSLMTPRHASRIGHRRAGEWLAAAVEPGSVLDTRGWTGFYSGRMTRRYDQAKKAFADPNLAFVVVEQRELEFHSVRGQALRHLLRHCGQRIAAFDHPDCRPEKCVAVYRWRPELFAARQVAERRRLQTNDMRLSVRNIEGQHDAQAPAAWGHQQVIRPLEL